MTESSATSAGAVTGGVRTLLRAEGAALFLGPTVFYALTDAPWELYALVFFAPDLGLLGYLLGRRIGAIGYNALHTTIGPLLLAIAGVLTAEPLAGAIATIWLAHIGFDRMFGLGLKYATGFRFTHLGRIGKQPDAKPADRATIDPAPKAA
ncbi:MAG TPA: DUF4260 domain-containing protein [Rhodopseudomonas sp.]|uniref:DUF4260 domain-containing protein n=1 Tax=Rhodopseudomonas sp. TaxID=1078 RepID=UPI002ED917D0